MNPKEFGWEESQQVTVVNPTEDDFKFKVHNMDYEVKAGARVKMPGYIAWVYVYNMATKLCQEDGNFNRWNEENYRPTYFKKVAVGADSLLQEIVEEPKAVVFETEEPKKIGRPPKAQ